ncbi:hypothetical protein OIU84_029438 [Salix udensis]|uniref:NAC domain-containing protein n=1 Tax=Salix udensis TaxID=889485 RepID=A0AAD6K9T7_9ROSI|nr:hypothetical protein OIU84_029438 [Salix udensis]
MGDHGYSGNLPPGFVFSPTDEELVLHFLHRKASLLPSNPSIIPDLSPLSLMIHGNLKARLCRVGTSGVETNWMMKEYHLCSSKSSGTSCKKKKKSDCHQWILCRVYEREGSCIQNVGNSTDDDDGTELSCLDEMFLSMDDDLDDISFPN